MEISQLFNFKNWVVVGDVLNQQKYAHKILLSFEAADFNVFGVNPRDKTGKTYKSLTEVPYKIDAIDLCINPLAGISILREAKKLGINKVLIQPGAESTEILNFCKEENITAIEGCALVQLSINHNVNVSEI